MYIHWCPPLTRVQNNHHNQHNHHQAQDALVVIPGSGMCTAGFTGYAAPRAVFLLVGVRPQMLVLAAGMDEKECHVSPCR